VPTASAGAVPITANPLAANKAKATLRIKTSLSAGPACRRFIECNPNRENGFPSTHVLDLKLVTLMRQARRKSEGAADAVSSKAGRAGAMKITAMRLCGYAADGNAFVGVVARTVRAPMRRPHPIVFPSEQIAGRGRADM